MAKNNRVPTKWARDGIKSNYKKACNCAICGTTEDLELHHYTTFSLLLKKYARENNIPISTDDHVLAMREGFYEAHWYELVEDTVTLCKEHHALLHKAYGVSPPLHTANKQKEWVQKQKDKVEGVATVNTGRFSRFLL